MTSAIAVLTYNRPSALNLLLKGLAEYCHDYPTAIFDDGSHDIKWMVGNLNSTTDKELNANAYKQENLEIYTGWDNLGVAGNTNRALKWFERSGLDHLCLLNDDLEVGGNFVDYYFQAHQALGVGLLCFSDFEDQQGEEFKHGRFTVKRLTVKPGIMLSITKPLFNRIGYFDTIYGKYGNEHVDFTNRARLAGFHHLNGVHEHCLDVKHTLLRHQKIESALSEEERKSSQQFADSALWKITKNYHADTLYRPFALDYVSTCQKGIQLRFLNHQTIR